MAYNYRKLLGRIVEVYATQSAFASAIGLSERSLSLKLNNKIKFKQDEISKACKLLGISIDDLSLYFFNQNVQEN